MPSTAPIPRPPASYQEGLTASTAHELLKSRGFDLAQKPMYEIPRPPHDITDVGDSTLMTLFREITGWLNYLGSQLAIAEVDEHAAKENVTRAESSARMKSTARTATEQKAEAHGSTEVTQAQEEHTSRYAYRKLVASLYAGLDRDSFLISRELSRRLGSFDRDSRAGRYSA